MCQQCNSTRSQKSDEAYDWFVQWAFAHEDMIRRSSYLDWDVVFAQKDFNQRHLLRYYLKNVGCRIIDRGYEYVPDDVIEYLDNIAAEPCIDVVLFKDFSLFDLTGKVEQFTGQDLGGWYSPYTREAHAADLDDSSRLSIFHTVFLDGFIGVLVSWYAPKLRSQKNVENIAHDARAKLRERKSITWAQPMFDRPDALERTLREMISENKS